MTAANRPLLSYHQARNWQRSNPVRMAEVPVEHAVSLPIPTLRWGGPGYAQFANPASRRPERPVQLGKPDCWWVFDAGDGRLRLYARTSSIDFATGHAFASVDLPAVARTMGELRELHSDLESAMETVIDDFFAGRPGDPQSRKRTADLLTSIVPQPLVCVYTSLAPDFFSWLQA